MAVQPGSRERRTCSELIRTSLSRLSAAVGNLPQTMVTGLLCAAVSRHRDPDACAPTRFGPQDPRVASLGAGRGSG